MSQNQQTSQTTERQQTKNGKTRRRKSGQKYKKKKRESFKKFIYEVLKQVHPSIGISSKAMNIMDSFVNDMLERIAGEASKLAKYKKRSTISSREIQFAVLLLLPGDHLAEGAVFHGAQAIDMYNGKIPQTPGLWGKGFFPC